MTLICAPENPPRAGSAGNWLNVTRTCASGGSALTPEPSPLKVVLFWSPPSPNAENMSAWPSMPGMR